MLGLGLPALAVWQALKGWLPSRLFAAGEKGGLWDFSTLANLYQDSAGTTPCTAVGDPIGLVLDTKNGTPQLGPELAGSPFIVYTGNGTASESGGVTTATCTTNGTYGLRLNTNLSTGGATYLITFDVVTNSASRSLVLYENLNSPGYAIGITGVKTCRITAVASSGSDANMAFIMFGGLVGESFSIRSVSQKVISGNHLTQSTSTKRPVLGRMPATGVRNLLTYTEDFSNAAWTKSAGTSVSGQIVSFANNNDQIYSQYSPTLISDVVFTPKMSGSGVIGVRVNGVETMVTLTGTPTRYSITGSFSGAGNAVNIGRFGSSTATSITLENTQLELGSTATAYQKVGAAYDITESGVASVYTAYFDGLDDCLVSPSIDFTATDKMSVFGGIRTQNNGAQVVAELSASSSSNAGSFSFGAGSWVSGGDRMGGQVAGSSVLGYDSPANFAPPVSAVQTNLYDIAGSTTQARAGLRINGVLQSPSPGGAETTGTGNFGNYPLYVGQRGAASVPYKGFLSALCTRGAATDAALVTSMEKWLATRTPGVTLP